MTDNFEQAKDDILARTAGNGGPKPIDLLTAMGALALDHDNDHSESMGAFASLLDRLDVHQAEANVRDAEIAEIQEWRARAVATCQERVAAIVKPLCEELHSSVHQRHLNDSHGGSERRSTDPLDAEFTERRALETEDGRHAWAMWWLGSKIGYVLLAVIITVINIALNLLWYGKP